MSSSVILLALFIALILGACCYGGVRMIFSTMQNAPAAQAKNYAGRTVSYGLGFVWIFFAIGMLIIHFIFNDSLLRLVPLAQMPVIVLVVVACILGLIDDVYGSSASRGFKGHLKALSRGNLTTGGLKLFGISATALCVAALMSPANTGFALFRGVSDFSIARSGIGSALLYGILAGAGIALTSNFLNLCDLRPGRALKVYAALVVLGLIIMMFTFRGELVVLTALIALIPFVSVFGLDVGEAGMLGDTGANPFGALAGCLIVFALGTNYLELALYVVAVLGLNLLSEKVSFSHIISSNKFLSKLDNLGRLDKGNEK